MQGAVRRTWLGGRKVGRIGGHYGVVLRGAGHADEAERRVRIDEAGHFFD